jgi:hypothetical protein
VIIMQIISVALFLLGASAAALALPTLPGAGGCPGGYADGAEVERGRLVYVCQGGNLAPKGCIAEDLSRIEVGGHYDNAHYRRSCVASSDGGLTFEATGCVQNGQEHKVSESWEDGTNFYTCKQNAAGAEPQLVAENQGCVDSGKRVPKKEKVNKDDGVYSCEETPNGGSKLVQAGCVKEGKAYNAGDAIESGKYWFNCTRIGREKFAVKAAGCVHDGKRLNDGDRYFDGGVIYECTIDNDKTDVRATGCVQNDGGNTIERKLGCTWVQGTAPTQYEVQCVHDPATNSAKVVQVRCNYNVGGGIYNIDPGCYRAIDKGFAGCSSSAGSLNLQTYDAESGASGAGLHAC